MDYKYTKKNLFENIEKYQFTPFHGKEFLNAYKKSRTDILDQIKTTESEIPKIFELINKKKLNEPNYLKIFVTEFELIRIIQNGFTGNINTLNRIIKKFEINKKIFDEYDIMLEKNISEKKSLKNYILLSIICLEKFELDKNLKFLNCSLKLNDIICSVFNNDIDDNNIGMISFLIKKELEIVKKLQMGL